MGGLRPVVTTTGRGYASPPGLRKSNDLRKFKGLGKAKGMRNSQRLQFGFRPKGRSGKTIVSQYDSSDCNLCNWDSLEHRLASQQALPLASPLERQAVPNRPAVPPRCPSGHHSLSVHHSPSELHSSVAPKSANKHRVDSVQNGTSPNCRTSIARRFCTYRIR